MSLAQIQDRMEREFAAVRANLKRMEDMLSTVQRDVAGSRDARERAQRAITSLRDIEWRSASAHGAKARQPTCPSCGGAEPEHVAHCGLAAALAVLGA